MSAYVPGSQEKDLARFAISLQQLAAGRSNATGIVTLATSAATTKVTDANCAAGSHIALTAQTANASAEMASGNLFIAAATVLNGSFVISHTNSATTGRTFIYAISG